MKFKLKLWLYKNFGKADNPMELDWILIATMLFISIVLILAIKVAMTM